jgi:hypothetical protein
MITTQEISSLLNQGFSIIPCAPNGKIPIVKWKLFQNKQISLSVMEYFLQRDPKINVGIITGSFSNLVVIDIDSNDALNKLRSMGKIPDTAIVKTLRGCHIYFRPNERKFNNRIKLIDGVDVRGDNGIVIAPGSTHISGHTYAWEIPPSTFGVADIPDWLANLIQQKQSTKHKHNVQNHVTNGCQSINPQTNQIQTFDKCFRTSLKHVKKIKDAYIIRGFKSSMTKQRNIVINPLQRLFGNGKNSCCYYVIWDHVNEELKRLGKDFTIEVGILGGKSQSKWNNYFDFVFSTLQRNGIKVLKSQVNGRIRIYPT